MRLATEILTIAHGGNAVRLSPSLRAALHLQRLHGLGKLTQAVEETNVAIILDIVDAGTGNDPVGRKIIADTLAGNGVIGLAGFRPTLETFLIHSFGVDTDEHPAERKERKTGKPLSIESSLADLFAIGTGWLGWTPADTWAAAPTEIIAAQHGLIAKLKAIHGSADDPDNAPSADPDAWELSPEELRENLAKLRKHTKPA